MIGDAALIDDRSLLEHYARTRDAKAFNELSRRYAGLVYGTCLRVTQNPDDAQDVAQECFLELAHRAGTVRSSVPGWLHKVAKTRSVNAIKRDSARRNREQTVFVEEQESASEWSEIAPYVDAAVESLPEHLRLPVILHYFHGLEQTQVAYHLRVNQSTVSRRLDKAVEMLRKELQRAGVGVTIAALGVLLGDKAVSAAPAALTASLGKMAITGPGGAAATGGMVHVTHVSAQQVLGTVAGKLAIGTVIGIVALSIAYRTTRPNPDTAVAAPPTEVAVSMPTQATTPVAAPAPQAEATVTPMETYRGDPFAPIGYDATRAGRLANVKAPIADLPVPRLYQPRPASGGGGFAVQAPPPVQPTRRMTGLIQNNGISAVIESNGISEVVVPGQMLSDRMAYVGRIENNRVILHTTGANPIDVVVGLTPAPDVSQINPPTAPGAPPAADDPRPVVTPAVPGVPVARPGGGGFGGPPAARRGGAVIMMPAARR